MLRHLLFSSITGILFRFLLKFFQFFTQHIHCFLGDLFTKRRRVRIVPCLIWGGEKEAKNKF